MGFILQRIEDGKFVAPSGSEKSYTFQRRSARVFATRAEAEADRCGNERILPSERRRR